MNTAHPWRTRLIGTAAAVATSLFTVAAANAVVTARDGQSYWDWLTAQESSGKLNATNSSSTATGSTQMTVGALQSVGMVNVPKGCSVPAGGGEWPSCVQWRDNPYGIKSREDYMRSQEAQQWASKEYGKYNFRAAKDMEGMIGKDFNGTKLNQAAILDCMYYLGAGDCKKMLNGQPIDPARAKHAQERMAQAAKTDSNLDPTGEGATGNTEDGRGGGGQGLYCNPQIAQMQVDQATQIVEQHVLLASDPTIGYTTLDGGSVQGLMGIGGAGGSGGGRVGLSQVVNGQAGFMQMSCLERLMNGGLDVVFSPPRLPDLLALLEQAICQQANQMFRQLTQPISQSISQTADLGGFFPGMGLGSIGGGVNVRARTGMGEPGGIRTNLEGVLSGNNRQWSTYSVGGVLNGNGGGETIRWNDGTTSTVGGGSFGGGLFGN